VGQDLVLEEGFRYMILMVFPLRFGADGVMAGSTIRSKPVRHWWGLCASLVAPCLMVASYQSLRPIIGAASAGTTAASALAGYSIAKSTFRRDIVARSPYDGKASNELFRERYMTGVADFFDRSVLGHG